MKLFGKEVSPKTLGILGAGLGGILGATGGKGQTSGTQGYTGGIIPTTIAISIRVSYFWGI